MSNGACGLDIELRSRVSALLSAHDLAGGFLPMDAPAQQRIEFPPSFGTDSGRVDSRQNVTEGRGSLELRCLIIEVTQSSEEFPQFDFNAFLQTEGV